MPEVNFDLVLDVLSAIGSFAFVIAGIVVVTEWLVGDR